MLNLKIQHSQQYVNLCKIKVFLRWKLIIKLETYVYVMYFPIKFKH